MTIVCVDDYTIALDGLTQSIRSILPDARIVTFMSVNEALDFVKENGLDAGFAYDGDADRCIAVDENGDIIEIDINKRGIGYIPFYREEYRNIANVKIAPSILAANFLFGAQEDVSMLHNGVDLNVFRYDSMGRESIRKEFGLEDKLVVGHIGRFHKQKNHQFLLEII